MKTIAKPKLYLLIGLPGSGKSTYANNLSEETGAVICSSDAIRTELYGDINDQTHNSEVFTELHKRINYLLENGNDVIYDATNINQKKRISFLQQLPKFSYRKAVIMATPYEECIDQNNNRDRKVPVEVIKRMREGFQFPVLNEGFDEIEIVWNVKEWKYQVTELLNKALVFNQQNSHHSLTLGLHMLEACSYLLRNIQSISNNLYLATRLHDIGKMETQTFVNKKGQVSEEAHYYGHQNVGAYNALFYLRQYVDQIFYDSLTNNLTDVDILEICTLIQYHMHPYLGWKTSEKAKLRDKNLLGEQLYEDIWKLHAADLAAH